MPKVYLLLLAIVFCYVPVQVRAQKLNFSYDASGNQSERRWVCINCRPAAGLLAEKKLSTGISPAQNEGDGITEKTLKVYPNPVSESVNVSWTLPNRAYVKSMEVIGMGGNRVFTGKYSPEDKNTQIVLNKIPPGTYLLVIKYSDSTSESVKLIKI
ncbi:T9SS type A sorting domain-containing protein [Pedobacter soli]|uniref:Por secretion system C-terminal sorting domain-containing protein n=1 Tax=Pedobacter soli TaxID=390242 RepID=A0A1G6WJ07_9SPHI|nr:T9SS type A sorting domain-containing protein [Pedobacter soli]SDD65950.1 Por secretion system C-terminal sorting domain-containing protein [Pedobacter soli]